MNIFADFRGRTAAILSRMAAAGRLPTGLDLERFVVEPPRDAAHGDLAVNAAMVLARDVKAHFANPRAFAAALAAELASEPGVSTAKVAGPGFINVRLHPRVLGDVLRAALRAGADFGRGRRSGERVNIDYVSANPTGPLHVGHARGAVFGDALANVLAFAGRPVTREYYIKDAGAQVDGLARSAFLRYREAIGASPEGLYPGDDLVDVGRALADRYGDRLLEEPESSWLPLARTAAIAAMMATIRDDLAALGIAFDVFVSERTLTETKGESGRDAVAIMIDDLTRRGLIYSGRLPPPKGQLPEDREQVLFRSTVFGDDVDRPLVKSDGSYTHFAADVAYHRTKIDRGFRDLIDVWGADHGGYVRRMQAAVTALSDRSADLDVKLCQFVKLKRSGEPVRMSMRAGDFVTLREIVDEVGADAVRFTMLFRKNDAPLEFDLANVIEQSNDNPVFYVQYAHARCRSVLRTGAAACPDIDLAPQALAEADFGLLVDGGETALMRSVAQFPRTVEAAAAAHEPHRIAFYLHDLASALHAQWNRGKDQPQSRFVNEERRDLSRARLGLVAAVAIVLASGLGILGVAAPDEMR